MKIIISDKKKLNTTPAKLKETLGDCNGENIEIYIRDLSCIKSQEHYQRGLNLLLESIRKIYEEKSNKEVFYADDIVHWFFKMPTVTIKTGWRVKRKLRELQKKKWNKLAL